MGDKTGISINNSNLQNMLSRNSCYLVVMQSLTQIIDRYYRICVDKKELIKNFKNIMMEKLYFNYNLLIENMKIENVQKLEDGSITFNLIQEYPVQYSYKLQYYYDVSVQAYVIKYDKNSLSKIENSFLSRFSYIISDEADQGMLKELLNNDILYNKEYSLNCLVKDKLPFKIILKNDKVYLEYTSSNNISNIFIIDFEKKDISYSNLVEEDEFLALFKSSLKEMLDGIFVESKYLPDAMKEYRGISEDDFCQLYLFNRQEKKQEEQKLEKKEEKKRDEDIPITEYYLIQGANDYKKVTGYRNVKKLNGRVTFEFYDGSDITIPENFLIVINNISMNTHTDAYAAHNYFEEKFLGRIKKGE